MGVTRATIAAGCLLALAAQAGGGAKASQPPPILSQAAEALASRHLPGASAIALRLARTAPAGEPPARSLLRLVDTLYRELQLDGAAAALELADRLQPISAEDRAGFALRRGLLQMEAFDEASARRTFEDGLALDRTARLPAFAPPKTAQLLEELRRALPPPPPPAPPPAPAPVTAVTPPAMPPPEPSLRSWAWAPAAGGAAMGVAGGALYLLARSNYERLAAQDPTLTTLEQVHQTADAGRLQQTCALALFGAGTAALATAAVLGLTPASPDPRPLHAAIAPGPSGLSVAGTFP